MTSTKLSKVLLESSTNVSKVVVFSSPIERPCPSKWSIMVCCCVVSCCKARKLSETPVTASLTNTVARSISFSIVQILSSINSFISVKVSFNNASLTTLSCFCSDSDSATTVLLVNTNKLMANIIIAIKGDK